MTEAERIEKPYYNQPTTNIQLTLELQQLKAENERLQQLIKEKGNHTPYKYWDEKFKESDKIADLEAELKSAQELNREYCELLNDFLSYLGVFKPDWKEGEEYLVHKIQSLINKAK